MRRIILVLATLCVAGITGLGVMSQEAQAYYPDTHYLFYDAVQIDNNCTASSPKGCPIETIKWRNDVTDPAWKYRIEWSVSVFDGMDCYWDTNCNGVDFIEVGPEDPSPDLIFEDQRYMFGYGAAGYLGVTNGPDHIVLWADADGYTGNYQYSIIIHEIGHALGQGHHGYCGSDPYKVTHMCDPRNSPYSTYHDLIEDYTLLWWFYNGDYSAASYAAQGVPAPACKDPNVQGNDDYAEC